MLVLTRRTGEAIIIGQRDMVIKILAVKGNQVKVGIEVDRNVEVHREEIYEKIERKRRAGEE